MKTKYPSMFGLLAALLLVVSFVLPTNVMTPQPVGADPGIMKWDSIITPGYLAGKNDVPNRANETLDMAVGGDGATILLTAKVWTTAADMGAVLLTVGTANVLPALWGGNAHYTNLYYSNNGGLSFSASVSLNFLRDFARVVGIWSGELIYHVAVAPDDPKFWVVTTDAAGTPGVGPEEVWITMNAGGRWERTTTTTTLAGAGAELIRTIDISVDYGGKRDIAIGTARNPGLNSGRIWVLQSTGFGGWTAQANPAQAVGQGFDFFAVKFSPTYMSDASLAAVFADNLTSTWYNIWLRDIDSNTTLSRAFDSTPPGIEVRSPTGTAGDSPDLTTLNKADLELPSDFSGQAASLRRAYISLDAWNAAGKAAPPNTTNMDGIFRIDDTTVYVLMDTAQIIQKSIYSIAYFGTFASGKLLVGERRGFPCTATVPTWFTDSPTTCPIPCWYPALKPTTGAANQAGCAITQTGIGGALVGWRADGALAYAATGSLALLSGHPRTWVVPWATGASIANDESAFAISRNNGETWNQLALIDTTITQFTDVAPTADCKTVYLASVNTGLTCAGFDSVWRSSSNSEVVSPLPAVPVGLVWERILTRVTATTCTDTHTNVALLRLVPYCADPSGQIVGWGVYDTGQTFASGIAMWSPDYGDYWASINPRSPIQDFTFESATVLYFLSPGCLVQKMPYTGTAWATTLANIDGRILTGHTIAAYPEGKVLVGSAATTHGAYYAATYSSNFNTDSPSFSALSLAGRTQYMGDVHVAFHPNFKDNNTIFIADEAAAGGSVYRNNPAAQVRWDDSNMMTAINGAIGCPALHPVGQFGLVLSNTGEALYSAHRASTVAPITVSAVERTIDDGTGKYGPLSGMPKPGIAWDCLNVFVAAPAVFVGFTLEPSSLKICGCCDIDSYSTLYSIDNAAYNPAGTVRTGLVWAYIDCLAKKGPTLITADKMLIGCDPVSGRSQEVNLCWEQLCVADAYDIEIAKSDAFTIKIIDWVAENLCSGFFAPADVTSPCAFFPAGGLAMAPTGTTTGGIASAIAAWGNLECGHTYYWRVKVRQSATTQIARSPWSEVRSFTVKAGLPVSTPYYGVQLLSPNNGGIGIRVKPVSFSWSPFKETTKYKFVLAKDAAMTQVVKEADVTTTAFEYDGTLDYSTNYFWRVMSVEPAPSDWSATFSFLTEAAPVAAPGPPPAPPTPAWVWVVIAIGAILVIVTLVLIFKTRRV
ncbi:MAG: hypothetical protein FJ005_05130 [Chloroflexi bacterium]|nr:hypothetical protein [Chloroflexota bacterium]